VLSIPIVKVPPMLSELTLRWRMLSRLREPTTHNRDSLAQLIVGISKAVIDGATT